MLVSRILAAVVSVLAPGAGHPLVRRFWRGAGWCLLHLVVAAGVVFWPPLLLATFAIRLAAAIDALLAGRGRGKPRDEDWIGAAVLLGTTFAAVYGMSSAMDLLRIPTGSMAPTLAIGDQVVVRTFRYAPAPGDVIVFQQPARGPMARSAGVTLAKRIVAVGGQTVAVHHQIVYVDGVALARRAIAASTYVEEDGEAGRFAHEPSFTFEERIGDRRYQVMGEPPGEADSEGDRLDFPAGAQQCTALGMEAVAGELPACKVPAGSVFVLGDNRLNSADSRVFGAVARSEIVGRVTGCWWASGPDGIGWDRIGRIR
jgi:signal peptidase I